MSVPAAAGTNVLATANAALAQQQAGEARGLQPQTLPRNAQALALILQSMGVERVEPRVIHQLLEFTFRTTVDFLEGAQTYAEHCGRAELGVDDVRLAIQNRVGVEFTGPPPREIMAEVAAERNAEPLPLLSEKFGLRLPAERHCLTQPNYTVLGPVVQDQDMPDHQGNTGATSVPQTPLGAAGTLVTPSVNIPAMGRLQPLSTPLQSLSALSMLGAGMRPGVTVTGASNTVQRTPASATAEDDDYDV